MSTHSTQTHGHESRVLVIYCGGTIGMLKSENGYVPFPGFLYESLRASDRFHDPSARSIVSNAGSMGTYQRWAAPRPPSPGAGTAAGPLRTDGRTLTVETANGPQALPCLVMPSDSTSRRILYAILEYDPLIDSSDVDGEHDWLRMARSIERVREERAPRPDKERITRDGMVS